MKTFLVDSSHISCAWKIFSHGFSLMTREESEMHIAFNRDSLVLEVTEIGSSSPPIQECSSSQKTSTPQTHGNNGTGTEEEAIKR